MKKRVFWVVLFALVFSAVIGPATQASAGPLRTKVRVGHFPNITHAQALIMHATGKVEKAFGQDTKVEWKVFNAGPSAVEALFAGSLDIAFMGPSPAVNAFVKSNGEALRVVAGAASGGAALVVRGDLSFEKAEDFMGHKIASPQLGNTQDVALRSWLDQSGLKLKEVGGNVRVLPIAHSDQQTLFIKKELDAAWTVEPWVSFLIENTGAKIYFEESELWAGGKYSTALVVVRKKFLDENPGLVKKFLEAHVEVTDWIQKNPAEAKKIVGEEIERESGKKMPEKIVDSSFARLQFSVEPLAFSVVEQANAAHRVGFLKEPPDLGGIFDLSFLEEIMKEKGTPAEWLEEVPQLANLAKLEEPAQK